MSLFSMLCVEEYEGGSMQRLISVGEAGDQIVSNGTDMIPTSVPMGNNAIYNSTVSSPGNSLSNGSPTNVTSLSLPAGDYSISAIVVLSGTVTATGIQRVSVGTSSATNGTLGNNSVSTSFSTVDFATGDVSIAFPSYHLTLASTSTVYLVAQIGFLLGSCTAYGRLTAIKLIT